MKRRNLVIGGGVIAVCVALMVFALGRTSASALKFSELATRTPDERCEVYGKLDPGSIQLVKGANTVRFDILEEGTGQRLQVVYDNPAISLPATFPAASHAKVTGSYLAAEQRFYGDTVLTKCPTKYNGAAKLDVDRQEAVKKWQKLTGLKPDAGT